MTIQINILSTKKLLPIQKQELLDANFTVIEEDFIECMEVRERIKAMDQISQQTKAYSSNIQADL